MNKHFSPLKQQDNWKDGEVNNMNPEAINKEKAGGKNQGKMQIHETHPTKKHSDSNEGNTRGTEEDDDISKEMDVSSRKDSSSMESQKDMKGEEGNEQTYFIRPLPDSPSKTLKNLT